MTTNSNNNLRLNYHVPKSLVPVIRQIADMDGQEPAYWIRKALERAVQERLQNDTKIA